MDQLQAKPQNNIVPSTHQNWLYIAVGVILLLVLGGGVQWYFSLKTPLQESKKESTSQDQGANWKTYQNEKYGFEFKYPGDFVEQQRSQQDNLGGTYFSGKRGGLFLYILDKKFNGADYKDYGLLGYSTQVGIGPQVGFMWQVGTEGGPACGWEVATQLNEKTLSISFSSCDWAANNGGFPQDALFNNAGLITKVLSTFKFTK